MDEQELLKVLFFSILLKHNALDKYLEKSKKTALQLLDERLYIGSISYTFSWADEYQLWNNIHSEWVNVYLIVLTLNFKI
jgi:hypothetical protein